MEHPVLTAIARTGFTPLGWFAPDTDDGVPGTPAFLILIGNAGPTMFRRFARERAACQSLDQWTRQAVSQLATTLDATPLFPFDAPPLPFLRWARRGGAGHISPLGLNIHPHFGLWHAYRAALAFTVAFDLPPPSPGEHPCGVCAERPCLSACPVGAFTSAGYNVGACAGHLGGQFGGECMADGCMARRACPVGRDFIYEPPQIQFHMAAFLTAQSANRQNRDNQG